MSLPLTLRPGFVSIYGAASTQGFQVPNNSTYQFGLIDQIFDIAPDGYDVGQSVMFNPNDGVQIISGGSIYNIINSNKILLTENPVT